MFAEGNLSILRLPDLLFVHTHSFTNAVSGLADIVFATVNTCNAVYQIFGLAIHIHVNCEFFPVIKAFLTAHLQIIKMLSGTYAET